VAWSRPGAGGMTAMTTGLAGQQHARPARLSARQSMSGMAAAGRWRSAGPPRAVTCCANSVLMTVSLPQVPGRYSGPLLPGPRAEGPGTPGPRPAGCSFSPSTSPASHIAASYNAGADEDRRPG
jgi:hypothetical protein